MFIPVGSAAQKILQIDKDENGVVTEKPLLDVMVKFPAVMVGELLTDLSQYVPLTDREKQLAGY